MELSEDIRNKILDYFRQTGKDEVLVTGDGSIFDKENFKYAKDHAIHFRKQQIRAKIKALELELKQSKFSLNTVKRHDFL